MIYIIGIAVWLCATIWMLWVLRKRSNKLKDDNNSIYSDELKAHERALYDYDDETFMSN